MAMGSFLIAIFFAAKNLGGAALAHTDTSRLIQSSSTLGNSSGLCSKAYWRAPNTAGR
jgi:hypothetical protein